MPNIADRITTVAKDLLIAHGSSAVTMRKVAAEIGVTPMALYRYFPSRDALLEHLADECFAELGEQWSAVELPGSVDEAIRPGAALLLDFALAQPRLYAFMFFEVRPGARAFPNDFRADDSPTFRVLTGMIRRGMDAGQLREDDPWRVGLLLTATLQGLIQLHQGGRIGLPDKEFRELCFDSLEKVLNGLKTS